MHSHLCATCPLPPSATEAEAISCQQDPVCYPCKWPSPLASSSMHFSLPPNGALMTDQCTDQCVVITCNDPDHVDGIPCDSLYATPEHHGNKLGTFTNFANLRSRGQLDYARTSKCSVQQVPGGTAQCPGCGNDCNVVYSQNECAECMPTLLDDIFEFQCCSNSYSPAEASVSPSEFCAAVANGPGYFWHQTPLASNLCTNCGRDRLICAGCCLGPKTASDSLSSQITIEQQTPSLPYHLNSSSAQSAQAVRDGKHTFPIGSMTSCQWGQCQASFSTSAELIEHVNHHHLSPWEATIQTSNETSNSYPSVAIPDLQIGNLAGNVPHLSCHWRNCTKLPEPNPHSYQLPYEQWRDLIAVHVFRDHLGLPPDIALCTSEINQDDAQKAKVPNEPSTGTDSRNYEPEMLSTPPLSPSLSSLTQDSTEAATSIHTPAQECLERTDVLATENMTEEVAIPIISTKSSHKCLWRGCNEVFRTCEELTAHLSKVHVGSGRAIYECFWEGCTRNKEAGFGSRQKINRHLQSHTGHRPFQCSVCRQNFSEVATLQQHMRRHTQEKPYVCDHPGCGKSFAIAGALTIHKRIHNGQRPFKCPHCDRAFAESSNLSKHMRTHTGVKPYSCPEAGCKKTFARPDQLTRHVATHKKKARSHITEQNGIKN